MLLRCRNQKSSTVMEYRNLSFHGLLTTRSLVSIMHVNSQDPRREARSRVNCIADFEVWCRSHGLKLTVQRHLAWQLVPDSSCLESVKLNDLHPPPPHPRAVHSAVGRILLAISGGSKGRKWHVPAKAPRNFTSIILHRRVQLRYLTSLRTLP